ncbi:MAG: hypothetical protein Kow0099_16470 [Candidatus Abyssubacteria bacterium]
MPIILTEAEALLNVQPIEHVRALCAEIGPRGPTTEDEARAAAYAAARLEEIGARDVTIETFRSVPSLWWALEVACAVALVSTPVFLLTNDRLWGLSVFFCVVSLYFLLAEFNFWSLSLSDILPKRISQNVYGKIAPKGEPRKKLVVIGHLDTNRTPIFFHPRLVRFLPWMLGLVFACIIAKALLFLVGGMTQAYRAPLAVFLVLDIPIAAGLVAMLHGDLFSPFTEGANDNATGAAVVLSLAELFSREPLENTEYWALCTGCEEATLTGIKAFLARHGDELRDAYFVDLECLGIGQLRFITHEGMLKKYHSNPGLVRAAADAARAVDADSIRAMQLKTGYTETAIVVRDGFRGITLMAFPEDSELVPHWHRQSDRVENIDAQNLTKAIRYLAALARDLDAG